jgi:membrane protease YdiL (CAAX protease family)
MPAVRAYIEKHVVLIYFALTFAISWGGVLMVIGGPRGLPGTTEDFAKLLPFAIVAMLAGPSIASLLLTGLVSGRAGLREALSHLLRWRVDARWYAVALLSAPLVFVAVHLALLPVSPTFLPAILTTSDKTSMLLSAVAAAILVGFCEELGWTGFATPRLRLRYGLLPTGLILGVLWGAWHVLPVDLWASASSSGGLSLTLFMTVRGLGLLVGQLLAYRLLMVWVYDRTGSLFLAMLMHASLDASTFIVGPGPLAVSGSALLTYDLVLGLAWWIVVAAVAVANRSQLASYLRSPATASA